MFDLSEAKVAVIGLGYVGLPLAVEFSKKFPTLGFDINEARVGELKDGFDATMELSGDELNLNKNMNYSCLIDDLVSCNIYIVTVPTPIDNEDRPDLTPLVKASAMIGKVIRKNDIVIYESTVYPGATEEVCLPEVERVSGLVFNKDFFAGYSPERINPGDKEHRVSNIIKITSGSTVKIAELVDQLYRSIIHAGTHKASSIKVAEAAKVIENTQRDVNIALINELAIIFSALGIDTLEVLEAAGTKWNFLPFRPGLVGGHCIGVDPYYLAHKAQSVGCHPDLILAARQLNDGMGSFVVSQLVKKMLLNRIHVNGSNILVMGLTFKEDCPDLRNSKVIDIVRGLEDYGVNVDVVDPLCSTDSVEKEYGFSTVDHPRRGFYDAIILAVGHEQFRALGPDVIKGYAKKEHVLYDLKYVLDSASVDMRL
jgi:UDP-N-acetyl-D-glucosamine/UDP-N-acetyl-D-galactosamine dehydrogenase